MSPWAFSNDQAVGAVESPADRSHHIDQRRLPVARQLAADLVHDDFGVGLASQMVVAIDSTGCPAAARSWPIGR